jgi:hypothetical protein
MTTAAPFNPEAHAHLIDLGFTYTRFDEDWEDVGTGETGPMVRGHAAFDEYVSPEITVTVDKDGHTDWDFTWPDLPDDAPPEWAR